MPRRNAPVPDLVVASCKLCVALPLLAVVGCTAPNPLAAGNGDPYGGPPHALGQIRLGEVHPASGGAPLPQVSARFYPDAQLAQKCGTPVGGCTVMAAPDCGTSPSGGCKTADGEVCAYDDSCQPRCTKACTASCPAGQECYFPSPGAPACRERETFDAGSLTFAGTTTPLTLYPPYSYSSSQGGAPFAEMANISVSASGATRAGFAMFQVSDTATTYLRTSPPLSQLTRDQVFGGGAVPLRWVAGTDDIEIAVSGLAGTATCPALDAAGSYDLPPEVVAAVVGSRTDVGQQLTVTVARQRSQLSRGLATRGSLLTETVQPEGWLQLQTSSGETATIKGCDRGTALCSASAGGSGPLMCVDVTNDAKNCGKCNSACDPADSCRSARCCGPAACDSCLKSADAGACMSSASACQSDPGAGGCASLSSCVAACTTTGCRNACIGRASAQARTLYDQLNACHRSACSSACTC